MSGFVALLVLVLLLILTLVNSVHTEPALAIERCTPMAMALAIDVLTDTSRTLASNTCAAIGVHI
eukprot:142092-Lingulodinium_polyedra.AAC.1